MNGIHEVRGSIPLGSTNLANTLGVRYGRPYFLELPSRPRAIGPLAGQVTSFSMRTSSSTKISCVGPCLRLS
jgi:hypothetical protein